MFLNFIGSVCFLTDSFLVAEKKSDGRSRVDPEADNQQLMQLEEKDVVTSVATLLSDMCGPGDWMAMEKLHTEVSSSNISEY